MSDDDKPFACTTQGCGMRFTNEDHLTVHMKKHDMSLALNTGSNLSPNHLFLDQTPTPTKFLKNCEEIGLFQELNKNPFEEAFKKASDVDVQPESAVLSSTKDVRISPLCGVRTPTQNSGVPLPGPHSNSRSLDTPSSAHLKTPSQPDTSIPQTTVTEDGTKENQASPDIPSSQSATQANQPTSTTSDDEVIIVSKTQAADSSTPTTKTPPVTTDTNNPILITMEPPATISPSLQSGMGAPVVTSPQYTMQVLLQLPTGQTVPVQIPASLSTQAVQVTSIPITPATQILASKTSTAPSLSNSATAPQQPSLAKQKLKAALQQSAHHSKLITSSTSSHTVSPPSSASVVGSGSTIKTVIPSGFHAVTVAGTSATSSAPHSTTLNNCLDDSSDSSYMEMDSMVGSPDSLDSVSIGGIKRKREDGDPEDRRRKFLERNRAAAARCRQRRKQWITNLEKKAEELQNTNNRLQSEVNSLRNEVAQLKTLLLAHKDCPITLQQKSQGQLSIQTISMPVVDGVLIDTGDVATAEAIATSALTNMAQRGVIVEAADMDEGVEIVTLSPKVQVKKEV